MTWWFIVAQFCASDGCSTMIADPHPTGFCETCEKEIKKLKTQGEAKVDQMLALEAKFIDWCLANGHPHPHS